MMTFLMMIVSVDVSAQLLGKKKLRISVVPSDAQISVDGNYVGDGIVEVTLDKSDFIAITLVRPLRTIFYCQKNNGFLFPY